VCLLRGTDGTGLLLHAFEPSRRVGPLHLERVALGLRLFRLQAW
jgi:hypothetical protein